MANSEAITLAKALSVKNRLAGRLSQARSNVETYNCVQAGQRSEQSVDVRAEFDRYRKLQEALVTVKAAIQRANAPVYDDILRLGEIKSTLKMLGDLNTKQGKEAHFGGAEVDYDSVIRKPEVLDLIRALEGEIDSIQDALTQFNASTRVEIAADVLDLAR
ncbi:MAG: hypothetical protein SFX72_13980 [Isosphaeraceae bacterium]|nr:hypothetical protein [Isosphaeraceae bacterium]